ncbi:MAG: YolD-like family protein [Erysipelotrichaceae bacterium]|nr:YolD-like family protein [Erysipelotrichaceae bacterium]
MSRIEDYYDIIKLPHHVSRRYPPMDRLNRAGQFAPFAALTGYEGEIRERQKFREERRILSEEDLEVINETVRSLNKGDEIKMEYYDGMKYCLYIDTFLKIDVIERKIYLSGGTFSLDDIIFIARTEKNQSAD